MRPARGAIARLGGAAGEEPGVSGAVEPTWSVDALSRAAFRRRLRQTALEWHEDGGYGFLIFRRDRQCRLLGGVNLSNIRRGVAQSANLGY